MISIKDFRMSSQRNKEIDTTLPILKRDLGIDIHEFTIGGEPVVVNEASDNDVWMIQENKKTNTPIYNSLYSQ